MAKLPANQRLDRFDQSEVLIHRSPERWAFYSAAPPLAWSDQLGCWITANRDVILSILKNNNLWVIDFREEARRLSCRLGIDLRATEQLFNWLPLALEGHEHTSKRRTCALAIRQNSRHALEEFARRFEQEVANAFANKRSFDVVSEIFAPSVGDLLASLTGVRPEFDDGEMSLTRIFDRMLSANRRRHLNGKIAAVLDDAGDTCPHDEIAMKAALSVVGTDSLLGSLTESFVHEIKRNAGKRMSEISWSDKLTVTSVPYVERIAKRQSILADQRVEVGQRVRVYLDALKVSDHDDLDYYFGAARHTCLGKAVSIEAWRTATSTLGRINKSVRIGEIRYRRSDFVFNTPAAVEVVISDD